MDIIYLKINNQKKKKKHTALVIWQFGHELIQLKTVLHGDAPLFHVGNIEIVWFAEDLKAGHKQVEPGLVDTEIFIVGPHTAQSKRSGRHYGPTCDNQIQAELWHGSCGISL